MPEFEVAEVDNHQEVVMQARINNAVSQILQEIMNVSSAVSKVDVTKLQYVLELVDALRDGGFSGNELVDMYKEQYKMAKAEGDHKSMMRITNQIVGILSDVKAGSGQAIKEIKQINVQNNNTTASQEDIELMQLHEELKKRKNDTK